MQGVQVVGNVGVGEGGVGLWCVCHFGLRSFQLQIASTPQQSADLSFAPGWVLGPGEINMAEASVICLSSRSAWLGLDGVIHKKSYEILYCIQLHIFQLTTYIFWWMLGCSESSFCPWLNGKISISAQTIEFSSISSDQMILHFLRMKKIMPNRS